jgi:hypothetical protein
MFYKLLATNLCHNGFTYQEGLNVDTVPFNPTGECKPGGLYFTTFEHVPKWYDEDWPLIADVTLPPEAHVYAEPCGTKWKADRLVLSNIRPLSKFLAGLDQTTLEQMLTKDGNMLEHVDNQTEALCLAAVRRMGWALEYVHNQTDAICMAAILDTWRALHFVRNQTDAICMAAVQQNGWALELVHKQTDDICLAAVRQHGRALQFVHNQTDEIYCAAVKQDLTAQFFV